MIRILWVNGWPAVGGAERAQLALFERLRGEFQTHLVLPEDVTHGLVDEARALSIPYTTAPLTRLTQTLDPRAVARNGYRLLRTTRILTRLIHQHAIDLVHTAYMYDLPFCAPAARLTRTPLFWLIENPEHFNRVNRIILNLCRLRGYAGVSSAILSEARRAQIRAPFTTVVPNCFREGEFFPGGRPTSTSPERPFTIGYAGVFFERKKVVELCEAFGILCERLRKGSPSTVLPALHLAGDGEADYVDSMYDALRSYDVVDRTTFFRNIRTSAAMRAFYQRLDLYVMLSTREGLSVAMLEALACGCPSMILSPWGDDVIEDGLTGFRLSSPRPEDVASRMHGVMLDRDGLRRVGQRGAAHVHAHFCPAAAAHKLVEFYTLAISPAS